MTHQLGACVGQFPDGGDMFFIKENFIKKSFNVFKFTVDIFVTMHACYVLSPFFNCCWNRKFSLMTTI
jgi:hypothetical protein